MRFYERQLWFHFVFSDFASKGRYSTVIETASGGFILVFFSASTRKILVSQLQSGMRELFSSIFSSQSSNLQVAKAFHRKPLIDLFFELQ